LVVDLSKNGRVVEQAVDVEDPLPVANDPIETNPSGLG